MIQATKPLLDFIIKQSLELDQYKDKLPALLDEKFEIKNKGGTIATGELVDAVIYWEQHIAIYESLEEYLNCRFNIETKLR
jgi:DNA repair photolyase